MLFDAAQSNQTRRQALNLLGIGALGALGFGVFELVARATAWQRRFTGSRVVAEFSGNAFPVTHSGAQPEVDMASWRLRVRGNGTGAYTLTYAELIAWTMQERTATLDCTLGWAATQNWRGIPLRELLARAGWDGHAPVSVHAATGASVGLSAQDVDEVLVATHVGEEMPSDAHGFPARLVVPSRRGYHWLKWVEEIVIL